MLHKAPHEGYPSLEGRCAPHRRTVARVTKENHRLCLSALLPHLHQPASQFPTLTRRPTDLRRRLVLDRTCQGVGLSQPSNEAEKATFLLPPRRTTSDGRQFGRPNCQPRSRQRLPSNAATPATNAAAAKAMPMIAAGGKEGGCKSDGGRCAGVCVKDGGECGGKGEGG